MPGGARGQTTATTGRPRSARPSTFRELEVWQAAHDLAVAVYRETARFPKSEEYGLTGQLRRAAVAVPANIAEGNGRRSRREYLQFCSVARGSLSEVQYLLLLARDVGLMAERSYEPLRAGYDSVGRMLNGLMTALARRSASPQSPVPNPRSPR